MNSAGILTATGLLAAAFVGGLEGTKTKAYRDILGIPTVCMGETRGVKMGDEYSLAECRTMFGAALVEYEGGMRSCVKEPDKLPAKTYVAFISGTYNLGVAGFCKSSMVRLANAGDLRGACDAFMNYRRGGKRVIQGLINRRIDERKLCLEGLQ